jgi:hypothetical protein
VREVVARSRRRNAGHVFISPLPAPKAYTELPGDDFWQDALAAIRES